MKNTIDTTTTATPETAIITGIRIDKESGELKLSTASLPQLYHTKKDGTKVELLDREHKSLRIVLDAFRYASASLLLDDEQVIREDYILIKPRYESHEDYNKAVASSETRFEEAKEALTEATRIYFEKKAIHERVKTHGGDIGSSRKALNTARADKKNAEDKLIDRKNSLDSLIERKADLVFGYWLFKGEKADDTRSKFAIDLNDRIDFLKTICNDTKYAFDSMNATQRTAINWLCILVTGHTTYKERKDGKIKSFHYIPKSAVLFDISATKFGKACKDIASGQSEDIEADMAIIEKFALHSVKIGELPCYRKKEGQNRITAEDVCKQFEGRWKADPTLTKKGLLQDEKNDLSYWHWMLNILVLAYRKYYGLAVLGEEEEKLYQNRTK